MVRTLHHYDEIGLLSPSNRTGSRHRLYSASDVARLQQIRSLRQLGFSLDEIRETLRRPDYSPRDVIARHIDRLGEQIELQQRLHGRLAAIAAKLDARKDCTVGDFLETIKETEMVEKFRKYYTDDQLEYLAKRRELVGGDRIREVEKEWPELLAQISAEMAKGTDPADECVQALSRRYRSLIEEFTGGDSGIMKSLQVMYRADPNVASEHGYTPDPKMSAFVGKALAASDEAE